MIKDAIAELERLVGERAFIKGAAAYLEGKLRHAPAMFGVYSVRLGTVEPAQLT